MIDDASARDHALMNEALALAARGEGTVEPNPMVGCLIVAGGRVVGRGWHQRFGGPHAEVGALAEAAEAARGGTMYVTLEPCCHHGKTPPCVDAILQAGLRRVVVAMRDPFPKVDGGGLGKLRAAGVDVVLGPLAEEAESLNGPYLKRVRTGRPWVIAKWAMTLDGKLASRTGSSQWISNAESRAIVHDLRGRMDAIIVGRGTAAADDPLLTARPPGPRIATRIVLDSQATLASDSQLARTARQAPVLVAVNPNADPANCQRLREAGCELLPLDPAGRSISLPCLLDELGRRDFTNVLIEGGSRLLGSAFDDQLIDEVHAFVAPKLIGGSDAPSPIGGRGLEPMAAARNLDDVAIRHLDGDLYISGRIRHG